ncbi:MAG: hypothetical protein QG588_1532 [Candidatus Poribacteria bacterium]|nr:hypothetical protein [Candidatus Poribacteria bacterium]
MSKANTKRTIEYIGEILPDGHLSIPDYVKEELEQYEFSNLSVTITVITKSEEQTGWEVFKQMGRNAGSSGLSDVSENHDKYLYGKPK